MKASCGLGFKPSSQAGCCSPLVRLTISEMSKLGQAGGRGGGRVAVALGSLLGAALV